MPKKSPDEKPARYVYRTWQLSLANDVITDIIGADARRVALTISLYPNPNTIATDCVTVGYRKGTTLVGIASATLGNPCRTIKESDIGGAIKEPLQYYARFGVAVLVTIIELLDNGES